MLFSGTGFQSSFGKEWQENELVILISLVALRLTSHTANPLAP